MEKISEKIINVPHALHLLQKRQKEGELGYEQQNTLAYLEKVAKLGAKEADALAKALSGFGLPDMAVASLIAILPKKEEDVRQILAQENAAVDEEKVKEILKTIKEHAK